MNNNILNIFKLISNDNNQKMQEEGISLADEIDDLNPFFQPTYDKYSKNVWENCAIIICKRKNSELFKYLDQMFNWVQDLNWPGSIKILEKLKTFDYTIIKQRLLNTINSALSSKEYDWAENLCTIINDSIIRKRYSRIIFERIEFEEKNFKTSQTIESTKFNDILKIPKVLDELQNNYNIKANLLLISKFIDPIFIPYLEKLSYINDNEIKRLCQIHISKIKKIFDEDKIKIYDDYFNKQFNHFICNEMISAKSINLDIYNDDISLENILLFNNLILGLSNTENIPIILRVLNLFQDKSFIEFFEKYKSDSNNKIRILAEVGMLNINSLI